MKVIGFCASRSHMGKTTLLASVIEELNKRGIRTAVLKHGQHMQSAAGKDSARFVAVGAVASLYVSPEGFVLESRPAEELEIQNAVRLLESAGACDLILVEGYKQGPQRKIAVCRSDVALELPAGVEHLCAVVSDVPMDTALPQFRFEEIPSLCDYVLKNAAPMNARNDTK